MLTRLRTHRTGKPASPRRNRVRVATAAACSTLLLALALGPAVAAESSGPAATSASASKTPDPPRLPGNFNGKGRYFVPDLGVDVPFKFRGNKGDIKMVAGGRNFPIWFMNIIYDGSLYTVTYRWPGLVSPDPCGNPAIANFSRRSLNGLLARSRFVGKEILQGNPRRYVNHFRTSAVAPAMPPGNYFRIPIALGDVYVGQNNPGRFWKVLQFGFQDLFDPELDEWFGMDTFKLKPGKKVVLPNGCTPPGTPPGS